MPTMLTLTLQIALATAALPPAPPALAGAAQKAGAHVRVVAQGAWRGQPTTPYPTQAPPAPVVERFAPRRGFVWISGNYQWQGGRYVWTGGHWERERAGSRWQPGRWDWQGNRYVWFPGSWITLSVGVPAPAPMPPAPPPPPPAPVYYDNAPPPPPAPIYEAAPPPRAGFVWIPGSHVWRGGRYV